MRKINADVSDLLVFARAYSNMGTAMQEQLDDLVNGDGDMNPNAIKEVKRALGGANEELDDASIEFFLANN